MCGTLEVRIISIVGLDQERFGGQVADHFQKIKCHRKCCRNSEVFGTDHPSDDHIPQKGAGLDKYLIRPQFESALKNWKSSGHVKGSEIGSRSEIALATEVLRQVLRSMGFANG